jgi:hypothetical protein
MTRRGTLLDRLSFQPTPDQLIARRSDGRLTDTDLLQAATAVASRLEGKPGGEWGVHLGSPFALLATLAAFQKTGRAAVLLPHTRPEFVRRVTPQLSGLILDGAADRLEHTVVLPDGDTLIRECGASNPPAPDWVQPVGLLTSGSSGDPTCVWKTPDQLLAEVRMLETAFGAQIGSDRVFCGTTSHQHLFGFTFRVIWPFLSGRPFADGQIRIPGEVAGATRRYRRILLISSPAFLERAEQLLDFDALHESHFMGFSSGGPLSPTTACRFNAGHTGEGAPAEARLIEIYGSTETGALASRVTREDPPPRWQPLPGVRVHDQGGLLAVTAAHLHGPDPVITEDRAEVSPDGFVLKGRRDQIVKIADKRVSLTELNQLLQSAPLVADARAIALTSSALGGVVVPTPEGWTRVARIGKDAFCRALRDHLGHQLDRATTPKRWRLVGRLPVNEQGKIVADQLRALFAPDTSVPEWTVLEAAEHHWLGSATIGADLPVLDGHFPGRPILPGVAQIHWAGGCARTAFGVRLSGAMEVIKFRHPIVPVTTLRLALTHRPESGKVLFEYSDEEGRLYSSGRLLVDRD